MQIVYSNVSHKSSNPPRPRLLLLSASGSVEVQIAGIEWQYVAKAGGGQSASDLALGLSVIVEAATDQAERRVSE